MPEEPVGHIQNELQVGGGNKGAQGELGPGGQAGGIGPALLLTAYAIRLA